MPDEDQSSQFVDEIVECTLQALSENPAFDDVTLSWLARPGLGSWLARQALRLLRKLWKP